MAHLETKNQSSFLESAAVAFDWLASLAIMTLLMHQSCREAFRSTDISCYVSTTHSQPDLDTTSVDPERDLEDLF